MRSKRHSSFQGAKARLLSNYQSHGIAEGWWRNPVQELSANCLKIETKAHKKLIHAVKITILGSSNTLGQVRQGEGAISSHWCQRLVISAKKV